MASVPYEGGVPQVSPDSRPPEDFQRITPDPRAFGASIAKGVEQAGRGAEQVSENFFRTAEFYGQVTADDQSNKTQQAITHLLHGDPNKTGPDGNPDTGFFGLQGEAALRARPDVEKQVDDIVKQGRAGLSPKAQLEYDNFTRRYRTNASEKVGTFIEQQAKAYGKDTNVATAKLATDAIARSADNPFEVQAHAADLIHALTKNVQLHGGGTEQIAEAEATGKQIALKTWLDQIATTDPDRAMRMLDKNREIAGAQYDNMFASYRARADQQVGHAVGAATMAEARQIGVPVAGIPVNFIGGIKSSEGFEPRARWDYKQYTNGYGTRAAHAGEVIDQATAEQRFNDEIGKAAAIVDSVNPNLDPGTRAALTSLTFNAGSSWVNAGLGQKIRDGDIAGAQQSFLQYNQAGGQVNAGLAQRRQQEVAWFGRQDVAPSPRAVQAGAYARIESNPNLTYEQKQIAFSTVNQATTRQEIEDNQTERQRKQASDQAAGSYIVRISEGVHAPGTDFVAMAGEITRDNSLEWRTKEHLLDRLRKFSGEEQIDGYGLGWRQARDDLFSGKTTMADLIARDDITDAGLASLEKRWSYAKRSVDHAATERKLNFFLKDAYKQLSFEDPDNPFIKIRDPKGEHIFNAQFAPSFISRVSELEEQAAKTGDHKKLDDFLTEKSVMEFARSFRNQRDMAREKLAATGGVQAPEPAGAPLPPAPEGLNAGGWREVIGKPPPGWNHAQWGKAVELLTQNPTPEMIAQFDRFMDKVDLKAAPILQKLGINPEAAAAAEAAEGEARLPSYSPAELGNAPKAPINPAEDAKFKTMGSEGRGPARAIGDWVREHLPHTGNKPTSPALPSSRKHPEMPL